MKARFSNDRFGLKGDDKGGIKMISLKLMDWNFQNQDYVDISDILQLRAWIFIQLIGHCSDDKAINIRNNRKRVKVETPMKGTTSSEFPRESLDPNFETSFVRIRQVLTYLLSYISFHKLFGQKYFHQPLVH